MSIAKRALIFARRAHESVGQLRRYTSQPYIVHPVNVANIVKSVRHTPEMIAAAYLHDVIEDCGITSAQVHAEFGPAVGELVDWLTDVSTPADGTRAARKRLDREHLAAAPAEAQTIKMADLIDNTMSIRDRDPDFWRVYRAEKLLLLEVMTRGDRTLHARAAALCE